MTAVAGAHFDIPIHRTPLPAATRAPALPPRASWRRLKRSWTVLTTSNATRGLGRWPALVRYAHSYLNPTLLADAVVRPERSHGFVGQHQCFGQTVHRGVRGLRMVFSSNLCLVSPPRAAGTGSIHSLHFKLYSVDVAAVVAILCWSGHHVAPSCALDHTICTNSCQPKHRSRRPVTKLCSLTVHGGESGRLQHIPFQQ